MGFVCHIFWAEMYPKAIQPTIGNGSHRYCRHRQIHLIAATTGFMIEAVWVEMYPKATQPTIGNKFYL